MATVVLATGYRPGLIGHCLQLQAQTYARVAGFGLSFETGRARDIAEFFERNDPRSIFLSAVADNEVVGTIAIDGAHLGFPDGHLRWFVLDERLRGAGLGRTLLRAALDFADGSGFTRTQLWTFAGLDAARRLYEESRFVLCEQYETHRYGPLVCEQRFQRQRQTK